MAVNPKSMSGQDTLSMHLRAFTERIPPTGSLREMSGDSDLLVHPVHVRYRTKQILLYPYHSYIRYRSIPKPAVGTIILVVLLKNMFFLISLCFISALGCERPACLVLVVPVVLAVLVVLVVVSSTSSTTSSY